MDVQELVRLVRDGVSDREIAALVGLSRCTVSRYRRWATQQHLLEGRQVQHSGHGVHLLVVHPTIGRCAEAAPSSLRLYPRRYVRWRTWVSKCGRRRRGR